MPNATKSITIADVLRFISDPSLDPADRTLIVVALNAQAKQRRAQAKARFKKGMKVTFFSTRAGSTVTGTVLKVNRVNIDVMQDATGLRWLVSPQLLKPA